MGRGKFQDLVQGMLNGTFGPACVGHNPFFGMLVARAQGHGDSGGLPSQRTNQ